MPFEVKLNNRSAMVELLNREGDKVLIVVDGKEYNLDFVPVAKGKYSILHQNKSYNVEIIPGNGVKQCVAHTSKTSYEVEIVDAESKYLANRMKGREEEGESIITAPIPGKVVRILVNKGEEVQAGQTVIIISAMKMESEFKAKKAGTIIDIKVEEGQTVEARQEMVIIEEIQEKLGTEN